MNLRFLKSDGIGDLTLAIPSVQHFLSGIVVHHGVVGVLIGERYVGIPLPPSFGVVSKVNGSGPPAVTVNSVDHATGDKSVSHDVHLFCKTNMLVSEGFILFDKGKEESFTIIADGVFFSK